MRILLYIAAGAIEMHGLCSNNCADTCGLHEGWSAALRSCNSWPSTQISTIKMHGGTVFHMSWKEITF